MRLPVASHRITPFNNAMHAMACHRQLLFVACILHIQKKIIIISSFRIAISSSSHLVTSAGNVVIEFRRKEKTDVDAWMNRHTETLTNQLIHEKYTFAHAIALAPPRDEMANGGEEDENINNKNVEQAAKEGPAFC